MLGPVTENCISIAAGTGFFQGLGQELPPGGGVCAPMSTSGPTPPTWTTQAQLCELNAEPESCAVENCTANLPQSYGSALCVYQAGDLACPDGRFTERELFYRKIDDMALACDCSCNGDGVACQATGADFFEEAACTGTATPLGLGASACVDPSIDVLSWRLSTFALTGSCEAVSGPIQGVATPMDPVTVCCEPAG